MDPYATHLSPLVEEALKAKGPILELGCGDYSTPVLAHIARHLGVPFKVLTSDAVWGSRFASIADVEIVDWASVLFSPSDVVLLDNEQTTGERIRHLPALSAVSRAVVVHDLEACERHAYWGQMIGAFKTKREYRDRNPGTAVLTC